MLEVFWRQTNQKLLLVLQHIPKYPGKSVSTNKLRIRISPEPEKCTLSSVFQNLRISAYQWERKAEFETFFSVFANIWVCGNGTFFSSNSTDYEQRNIHSYLYAKK